MAKARQASTDIDDTEGASPDHPLFPTEEGEAPRPPISHITIGRWERGKNIMGPCFPAAEVVSTEQISALFGGGDYVLYARKPSKSYQGQPGQIICTRKITIPGRSLPLGNNPTPEERAVYESDGQTREPLHVAAAPSSGGSEMTQLLMAMLAQQSTQAEQARQSAAQQQQMFMTMIVQMMSGGKSESAEMTKLMLQMNAAQSQNMMQMMTVMMSSRGGGPEELAKYAELLKTLGGNEGGSAKEASGESLSSMVENVADIVQGIAQMKNGGLPSPGALASDGSAASVVQGMR